MTKPSEQAFKALISPNQVGGVILLFTNPVGRQEYDNLNFLKRHLLIPSDEDQKTLWRMPKTNDILKKAITWRGLRLPKNPEKSVNFLIWCIKNKIFEQMGKYTNKIQSDGVKRFWEEVIFAVKD